MREKKQRYSIPEEMRIQRRKESNARNRKKQDARGYRTITIRLNYSTRKKLKEGAEKSGSFDKFLKKIFSDLDLNSF